MQPYKQPLVPRNRANRPVAAFPKTVGFFLGEIMAAEMMGRILPVEVASLNLSGCHLSESLYTLIADRCFQLHYSALIIYI